MEIRGDHTLSNDEIQIRYLMNLKGHLNCLKKKKEYENRLRRWLFNQNSFHLMDLKGHWTSITSSPNFFKKKKKKKSGWI